MVVTDPEFDSGESGLVTSRPLDWLCVLEVRCMLDLRTTASFEQLLLRQLEDGCRALVIDLSECAFMGSEALGALVKGCERAARTDATLALAAPSENAARALQITGLQPLFDSYTSTAAAIRALSQDS